VRRRLAAVEEALAAVLAPPLIGQLEEELAAGED